MKAPKKPKPRIVEAEFAMGVCDPEYPEKMLRKLTTEQKRNLHKSQNPQLKKGPSERGKRIRDEAEKRHAHWRELCEHAVERHPHWDIDHVADHIRGLGSCPFTGDSKYVGDYRKFTSRKIKEVIRETFYQRKTFLT